MVESSNEPEIAERFIRACVGVGARPGDEMKDVGGTIALTGVMSDWPRALDYAEQQGWIERRHGDQYPRLTSVGFAMAQSRN